jgi:hypothetical protein
MALAVQTAAASDPLSLALRSQVQAAVREQPPLAADGSDDDDTADSTDTWSAAWARDSSDDSGSAETWGADDMAGPALSAPSGRSRAPPRAHPPAASATGVAPTLELISPTSPELMPELDLGGLREHPLRHSGKALRRAETLRLSARVSKLGRDGRLRPRLLVLGSRTVADADVATLKPYHRVGLRHLAALALAPGGEHYGGGPSGDDGGGGGGAVGPQTSDTIVRRGSRGEQLYRAQRHAANELGEGQGLGLALFVDGRRSELPDFWLVRRPLRPFWRPF